MKASDGIHVDAAAQGGLPSRLQENVGRQAGFGMEGTAELSRTGASTGIGAIYADRLARRVHDLFLVARSREAGHIG